MPRPPEPPEAAGPPPPWTSRDTARLLARLYPDPKWPLLTFAHDTLEQLMAASSAIGSLFGRLLLRQGPPPAWTRRDTARLLAELYPEATPFRPPLNPHAYGAGFMLGAIGGGAPRQAAVREDLWGRGIGLHGLTPKELEVARQLAAARGVPLDTAARTLAAHRDPFARLGRENKPPRPPKRGRR